MKSLLKATGAFVAAFLVVASTAALAYNSTEKPIYAAKTILVGTLHVENDNRNLTVIFDLTRAPAGYDGFVPGWTMQTTHLYVGKKAPSSSAPGRFPFKHEGLANVSTDKYVIPLSRFFGFQCGTTKKLYIAGHADTCEEAPCVPDFAAMAAALPTGLTDMTVQWNYVEAYLDLLTAMGTFNGWCFQENAPISVTYPYSTPYVLSVLPDGSPNPDAEALLGQYASGLSGADAGGPISPINYLNYLINQPYVVDCGNGGPYSFVDIQVAIWSLTDNAPINAYGANPANVQAIIDDCVSNGAHFVPGCGDLVLVLTQPVYNGEDGQHVGFAAPVSETVGTGDCETGWAKGTTKFCTGWGSYFAYYAK